MALQGVTLQTLSPSGGALEPRRGIRHTASEGQSGRGDRECWGAVGAPRSGSSAFRRCIRIHRTSFGQDSRKRVSSMVTKTRTTRVF